MSNLCAVVHLQPNWVLTYISIKSNSKSPNNKPEQNNTINIEFKTQADGHTKTIAMSKNQRILKFQNKFEVIDNWWKIDGGWVLFWRGRKVEENGVAGRRRRRRRWPAVEEKLMMVVGEFCFEDEGEEEEEKGVELEFFSLYHVLFSSISFNCFFFKKRCATWHTLIGQCYIT
jgi:hypothetical protein